MLISKIILPKSCKSYKRVDNKQTSKKLPISRIYFDGKCFPKDHDQPQDEVKQKHRQP